MSAITTFREFVPEESTWLYRAVMKDERGNIVPGGALTSLQLTLYLITSGGGTEIINGCDHTDILNTGRGTVDASGNLEVTFVPDDNPIIGDRATEEHRALIEFKYNGGAKTGRHQIRFKVANLEFVS